MAPRVGEGGYGNGCYFGQNWVAPRPGTVTNVIFSKIGCEATARFWQPRHWPLTEGAASGNQPASPLCVRVRECVGAQLLEVTETRRGVEASGVS